MSDLDKKLETLRHLPSPPPSAAARRRALEAAMLAFDAEQQKSADTPQGENWYGRLRSIFHTMKGSWIMDTRVSIGLGTAAVALLLLPLGYQLYTSTALTPPSFEQREPAGETTPEFQASTTENESTTTVMSGGQSAQPAKPVELQQQPAPEVVVSEDRQRHEAPVEVVRVEPNGSAMMDQASNLGGVVSNQAQAKRAVPSMEADAIVMGAPPVVAGAPAPSATVETFASAAAPRVALPQAMPSGDEFTDFDESAVKVTAEEPVSTFSIDVDTASYSYVRRMLSDGYMPAPDAVRIEEMINYFDYGYAGPGDASTPFRATMQIYPTPWNPKTQLLQIGIKGYVPPVTEDKASNLVFLLDTSGSMDEPDKLPLLKRAFGLLVDQLGANDTVSIVTYAGSAGVALEPTKATDKAKILGAIETLWAGGSTAGAHGIELAYQLATQHKVAGGINRVILATDGDFNVGIDDPSELVDFIKQKRGYIVNTSSVAGKVGSPCSASYSASKHAIQGYFDTLRMECAEHNIGVTNVCPGPVKSEITMHAFTATAGEKYGKPTEDAIKRMTAERCGELMAAAMWARLPEIWVGPQPILAYTYIGQYMPSLYHALSTSVGRKRVAAFRAGQTGYDSIQNPLSLFGVGTKAALAAAAAAAPAAAPAAAEPVVELPAAAAPASSGARSRSRRSEA